MLADTSSVLVTACQRLSTNQRKADQGLGIILPWLVVNPPGNRGYPHGLCSGTESPEAENAPPVVNAAGSRRRIESEGGADFVPALRVLI